MQQWQKDLQNSFVFADGTSMIASFNDERKIVEVHQDAKLEDVEIIKAALRLRNIDYEVTQLS